MPHIICSHLACIARPKRQASLSTFDAGKMLCSCASCPKAKCSTQMLPQRSSSYCRNDCSWGAYLRRQTGCQEERLKKKCFADKGGRRERTASRHVSVVTGKGGGGGVGCVLLGVLRYDARPTDWISCGCRQACYVRSALWTVNTSSEGQSDM